MKNNLWSSLSMSSNYTWSELAVLIKNYPQVLAGIGSLPEAFNASLLHLATRSGDIKLLEKVLNQEDVDINLPDKYGWTALHITAFLGYTEMFKFLVDKGADIHAKTLITSTSQDELTPSEIAVNNLHTEMTILCIDKGYKFIDISSPGRKCGNRNHKDYLEKLLNHYNNDQKVSENILAAIKFYNSAIEEKVLNATDHQFELINITDLHVNNIDFLGDSESKD